MAEYSKLKMSFLSATGQSEFPEFLRGVIGKFVEKDLGVSNAEVVPTFLADKMGMRTNYHVKTYNIEQVKLSVDHVINDGLNPVLLAGDTPMQIYFNVSENTEKQQFELQAQYLPFDPHLSFPDLTF